MRPMKQFIAARFLQFKRHKIKLLSQNCKYIFNQHGNENHASDSADYAIDFNGLFIIFNLLTYFIFYGIISI